MALTLVVHFDEGNRGGIEGEIEKVKKGGGGSLLPKRSRFVNLIGREEATLRSALKIKSSIWHLECRRSIKSPDCSAEERKWGARQRPGGGLISHKGEIPHWHKIRDDGEFLEKLLNKLFLKKPTRSWGQNPMKRLLECVDCRMLFAIIRLQKANCGSSCAYCLSSG